MDGAFFSLSVFASPMSPSHARAWSLGLSLMCLTSVPFMCAAGRYLSMATWCDAKRRDCVRPSKRARLAILCSCSCVCVCLLLLIGPVLRGAPPAALAILAALQGVPFNVFFLVPLEVLSLWAPGRAGALCGVGQMGFGLGTMAFSGVFELLAARFRCVHAVCMAALLLLLLLFPASFLLRCPSASPHQPLRPRAAALPLRALYALPVFWACVAAITVSQTGFVFIGYFFELAEAYGKPLHQAVRSFQCITLAAALCRPPVGMLADRAKTARGFWRVASKNVLLVALLAQTAAFAALVRVAEKRAFDMFVAAALVVVVVMAAGECLVTLLIRDLFGQHNVPVVYGAGACVGFGLGCFLPPALMQWCVDAANNPTPEMYVPFYKACVLWSAAGVVCTAALGTYQDNEVEEERRGLLAHGSDMPQDDEDGSGGGGGGGGGGSDVATFF